MRQRRVLKPFVMAAGMAVLACPTFSHGESGRVKTLGSCKLY